MPTQSSIHFYVNWAKERLDEMDATLTSLEDKVGEVQADARDKANKALADLRKKRDDFRDTIKKQSEANEAAWNSAKTKLESEWNVFEAEVKKYVESFGKQIEQQQATFKLQSAAQLKAWREAADKLGRLCQRIRSRTSGRNRCGREAHERRCRRGGGKTPEAEPSRGPVMVRTDGCPDGNARCLRSCQSGGDGCVQASRLIKRLIGLERPPRGGLSFCAQ